MGVHPGQKRGAKGTNLGGEFVGPKSIAKFLAKMLAPSEAHAHDQSVAARKPSAPPSRALGRLLARPSSAEAKMHAADREHAARLSTRASTLEDRLSARQYGHGSMSNAGARETARQKLAATRAELGPVQARVDARRAAAAEDKAFYGDHVPAGSLADARSAVARLQAKAGPRKAPSEHVPAPPSPDRAAEADDAIRKAFIDAGKKPLDWMSVADVRDSMTAVGIGRPEQDAALRRLLGGTTEQGHPYLIPSVIPHTLTQRERDAALHAGGEDNHLLTFRQHAIRIHGPSPASSTQTDTGGRITREEAGRRMLGDAEYERRAAAAAPKKKTAAGRMTAAQRAAVKTHREENARGREAANATMTGGGLGSIDAVAQAVTRGGASKTAAAKMSTGPADLSRMPVADLRKLATERKIPGRSKLKKAELILALGG